MNTITRLCSLLVMLLSFSLTAQDIKFSSQSDVDAFDVSLTVINGSLEIYETHHIADPIVDLSKLSHITWIKGNLEIESCDSLTDLSGLAMLQKVDENVLITSNNLLTNLDGLSNLQSIGGWLQLENLPVMEQITSLTSLVYVGSISIANNNKLNNISGFSGITSLEGSLGLSSCDSLDNIEVFSNLDSVGGVVYLRNLPKIHSLEMLANLKHAGTLWIGPDIPLIDFRGLSNLTSISDDLYIESNETLTNVDALLNLSVIGNSLKISHTESLANLDGLINLTSVGEIQLIWNRKLSNINGLSNVASSIGDLEIIYCDSLTDVNGLTNIDSVHGKISISYNDLIKNLDGLNNLVYAGANLSFIDNPQLENLDGLLGLTTLNGSFYLDGCRKLGSLNGLSNVVSIGGALHLSNLTNLKELLDLQNLEVVSGRLGLFNCDSILDLSGLNSLTTVGGDLSIKGNQKLQNLNGLSNLVNFSGGFFLNENATMSTIGNLLNFSKVAQVEIYLNDSLSNIDALSALTEIETSVFIGYNPRLRNLNGLSNAQSNLTRISVENNDALIDITGLGNLDSIELDLSIRDNASLQDLNGLQRIQYVGGELRIINNSELSECCALIAVLTIPGAIGSMVILDNKPSCNSEVEIVNSFCNDKYLAHGLVSIDFEGNDCDSFDSEYDHYYLDVFGPNAYFRYLPDSSEYRIYLDSGVNVIVPRVDNNNLRVNPDTIFIHLPEDSNALKNDICVSVIEHYNDLSVAIIPLIGARPGFIGEYLIEYENKGTNTLSGEIEFLYSDLYTTYQSAAPSPNEQNSGVLEWNYFDLDPFEKRSIKLQIEINSPMDVPPVNGGDILSFSATIHPVNEDENRDDNTFELIQTVVNSFDPNDKTCLQGDRLDPEHTGGYLNYLIRFENTGSASAVNVKVVDTIDARVFDLSTLEIVSSSHECKALIEGDVVTFYFNHILLSHLDEINDGYVNFRLKTREDLLLGDSLTNQADIYFDFNFPIRTNTAKLDIRYGSKNDASSGEHDLVISPNPAREKVVLGSIDPGIYALRIIDVRGAVPINVILDANVSNSINIQRLIQGLYFIEAVDHSGSIFRGRFVKFN